jgi:hypothetical protein
VGHIGVATARVTSVASAAVLERRAERWSEPGRRAVDRRAVRGIVEQIPRDTRAHLLRISGGGQHAHTHKQLAQPKACILCAREAVPCRAARPDGSLRVHLLLTDPHVRDHVHPALVPHCVRKATTIHAATAATIAAAAVLPFRCKQCTEQSACAVHCARESSRRDGNGLGGRQPPEARWRTLQQKFAQLTPTRVELRGTELG